MTSRIARIGSIPGLLLLVSTAAWAGRGDIDPNYGEGGRLVTLAGVMLALPGDRLVFGEHTDEGFRIRMVDEAGQNVPEFGEGGIVLINSSVAARIFQPESAALAPNGDMIFVGALGDTGAREVLRLDSDGQPVTSFGSRGDGSVEPFAEPARTTVRVILDPDGKIVLAEGRWSSDYSSCESSAWLQRLLADGQPDTEFGGDGLSEIPNLDLCQGVSLFGSRADGSVIVGDGSTIVAVDAAGDIDPTFGAGGRLVVSDIVAPLELAWPNDVLLPDGGLLIYGWRGVSPTANDTVFLKLDRNGQPDFSFGSGTSSVTVDLGAELLGEVVALEGIDRLVLEPDGKHVIAQVRIFHRDGPEICRGIARLTIDGTPDTGFGRNGLTCLNFNFALIALQSDGAPLFHAEHDESIHRLLPDNRPSPGLLRVVATRLNVDESGGTVAVAIERLAGRDGAVSVDFATSYRPPGRIRRYDCYCYYSWDSATAGSDYAATSGRLDWSSGDDGQRTVDVSILKDHIDEIDEIFGVDFSEPGGTVEMIGASTTVAILNAEASSTTPPPPLDDTRGGGGGSVSWATALALLGLLLLRRSDLGRRAARVRLHGNRK